MFSGGMLCRAAVKTSKSLLDSHIKAANPHFSQEISHLVAENTVKERVYRDPSEMPAVSFCFSYCIMQA